MRLPLLYALLALSLPLGACASLSSETRTEESVFQAENVVDMMQTLTIAREPARYKEVGTLSLFTGAHPTPAQVEGYSVALAGLHFCTTRLLSDEFSDKPWVVRGWEGASLAWKTQWIVHNHQVGLGFSSRF